MTGQGKQVSPVPPGRLPPAARMPRDAALMAERKPFLLRIDPKLLEQLRRWAADDLRSLNGQIEFLLRRVLREAGRESKRERDD